MGAEIDITAQNFDTEVASGVSLIDFWAPWCGPCKMQGPIVEKIAEAMGDKVTVGKCNVDDEQKLATKFSIRSIPTILILKDGKDVERLVGLQTEQVLQEKLDTYLGQ